MFKAMAQAAVSGSNDMGLKKQNEVSVQVFV